MKKRYFFILSIFIIFYGILSAAESDSAVPEIKYPVNDYANILSPEWERDISKLLADHRSKTGVQVAVLTVKTTGETPIEDYSIRTAEKWAGGSRGRDDGLLFVVAVDDHRMRLEVGYGLEGYITDLKAGRILDGIRKDFRDSAYGKGIYKAVRSIIKETSELKAGEGIPVSSYAKGTFYKFLSLYTIIFLAGVFLLAGLILLRHKHKLHMIIFLPLFLFFSAGVPVMFGIYFTGVWYWNPFVYITGAIAGYSIGYSIVVKLKMPNEKKNQRAHFGLKIVSVSAIISMLAIIILLDIIHPNPQGTSINETVAFYFLILNNLIQLVLGLVELMTLSEIKWGVYNGEINYGSSYSYSSSNQSSYSSGGSFSSDSSSSSSSETTSWSGGGGTFGGGGASSSW